ncbi:MAG: hypothetical protein KDD51_09115 [Bdellovibrionales bacterium]|nr:hypothetical protein [Bdellovibrionales bacterium]
MKKSRPIQCQALVLLCLLSTAANGGILPSCVRNAIVAVLPRAFAPAVHTTLTARLRPAELAELRRQEVPSASSESRQMLQALAMGRWEAPIFTHPLAPGIAYGLFRAGKISESQFVTHQFFWAARNEYAESLRFVRLVEGDTLTSQGNEMLTASRGLNDAAKERFATQATALPLSEQYVLQVSTEAAIRRDPRLGIADATFRTFLGMHLRPIAQQSWALVVPSFSLMQVYLERRYEERAMQGIPEFGVAPHDSIINQVGQHTRVITVPFPGIDGVVEGDGMYFGTTYGFLHDFYHLDRGASSVIPEYRVLFPLIFAAMLRHKRAFRTEDGEYHWTWQATIENLINLETQSCQLLQYGPPPSALDCFEVDYGHKSDHPLVGRVVSEDMRERPEIWEAADVNLESWQRRLN